MTPRLPTEIIETIINILVEDSTSRGPGARMDVLTTCSKVSWLFHIQARKHRFAHIYFRFDQHASKRAEKLLQTLRDARNHHLLSVISSVTFLLHPPIRPDPDPGHLSKAMDTITKSFKTSILAIQSKFKRKQEPETAWVHNMMFFLLQNTSLREMTIESYSSKEIIDWSETAHPNSYPEVSGLLYILLHPDLQHLTFRNIVHFPLAYLTPMAKPPSVLRSLVLENFTFLYNSPDAYAHFPPATTAALWGRFAPIKELRWSWRGTVTLVDTLFYGIGPQLFVLAPAYSALTVAAFDLSPYETETNMFLESLLSASTTLQSLDIHSVHTRVLPLDNLAPNYLGHFTALQRIGFKAKAANIEDLHTHLNLFSKLLLSATGPMPSLQSISVEIVQYCAKGVSIDDQAILIHGQLSSSAPLNTGRWPVLDNAICNPNFVNLGSVHFNLRLFLQVEFFGDDIDDDSYNLRAFLPRVYEHPLVSVGVSVRRIGGDDADKRWEFEQDDDVSG